MNLNQITYVHMLGIGGIGMSALARYFNAIGKVVSGYDKTESDLTAKLQDEGITIYFEEDLNLVPKYVSDEAEKCLLIYTPAVPQDHIEIKQFKDQGRTLYKRAQVLGFISEDLETTAIAGTHGKTSTTSLLTSILMESDLEFVSFIGGINENFGSNLIIQGNPKIMVTEADEYDRSFLQLHPKYSLITSVDADHLDIYGSKEEMSKGFKDFAANTSSEGMLFVNESISDQLSANQMDYGRSLKAAIHAENIENKDWGFQFDYVDSNYRLEKIDLHLFGLHNLENCVGAIALARKLGVSDGEVRRALSKYKGVKRRFDIQINREDFVFVDDYAHHPSEIDAVVNSLRDMFPDKKLTVIFQPHLFSRTQDFADDFAKSLSELDEVILLDIYPAREKPIPGVTSTWLLEKISNDNKSLCSKDGLVEQLNKGRHEVLVTLGAGDIDRLVPEITKNYQS